MAEIKSTLDLVMEKTKHLKLTREEREQQKYNELKKKLKGLLQKYKDAVFTFDQMKLPAASGRSIKVEHKPI